MLSVFLLIYLFLLLKADIHCHIGTAGGYRTGRQGEAAGPGDCFQGDIAGNRQVIEFAGKALRIEKSLQGNGFGAVGIVGDGFAHGGADFHPAGSDVKAAVIAHDRAAVQLHVGITVGIIGWAIAVTMDIQGHGDGALVFVYILGVGIYDFNSRAVAVIFDDFCH